MKYYDYCSVFLRYCFSRTVNWLYWICYCTAQPKNIKKFIGIKISFFLYYQQLYWSVRLRVMFKIVGLMHQSLAGAAPAYVADDCRLLSDAGHRLLWSNSNDMRKLLVPWTHSKLGNRSLLAASPRLCNDFPPGLRSTEAGTILQFFQTIFENFTLGNWSAWWLFWTIGAIEINVSIYLFYFCDSKLN